MVMVGVDNNELEAQVGRLSLEGQGLLSGAVLHSSSEPDELSQ